MKSKELILAEHIQDEANKYPSFLSAMDEYASQQTVALQAERDEYRKALEFVNTCKDPCEQCADIVSNTLAKHPQQ